MKACSWVAKICVVAGVCVLIGVPGRATTLMQMSVAQMARAAREIVRARCVENSVVWDTGELWTLTTFDIEESWRGAARGQITVRLLGGQTDAVTSGIAGVPRFRPGEEVILFLEPTSRGDYSVVSWQQGTFRVRRDTHSGTENITQDTASFETFDPATRHFAARGIAGMPLAEFRERVNESLAAAGKQP